MVMPNHTFLQPTPLMLYQPWWCRAVSRLARVDMIERKRNHKQETCLLLLPRYTIVRNVGHVC